MPGNIFQVFSELYLFHAQFGHEINYMTVSEDQDTILPSENGNVVGLQFSKNVHMS